MSHHISRQEDQEITAILEKWIDHPGINVSGLLIRIGEVCREKAEHIRANWQDDETADAWDEAADELEEFSQSFSDPV